MKEKFPNNEAGSEEPERKITTPEEAEEMTRQRRKEFDLEEEGKQLTPEEAEKVEKDIEELLRNLDEYYHEDLSPEEEEQLYRLEQEAKVGKDRELAKAVLEKFLNDKKKEAEKTEE